MVDVKNYLLSRGVDPNRTHVVIDEQSGFATFLLYNLSGQLVGYQQVNPEGDKNIRAKKSSQTKQSLSSLMKYFTFVGNEGKTKKIAVWGTDTIGHEGHVFVTEGVFDIAKVHNFGEPGIAVLSNNPKQLRPWFKAMGKLVIAINDNDAAGSKLSGIADVNYSVPDPYKDLGEMTQEEANEFLSGIIEELGLG